MAQNTFLNVTADKNAAKKQDKADQRHSCTLAAAASGDLTLSYDSAVITNLATLDSAYNLARTIAISAGLK